MFCPHCKSADHRVVDTRGAGDGIRRRRECHQCGGRFTTYEQVAASLMVVKSDGRREPYDRQKLLAGIRIACAKRPIAMADMERLVERVEEQLYNMGRTEVFSDAIGEAVLQGLKELDLVAYIRFATVYLELQDLYAVRNEIDKLLPSGSVPR